MARIDRQLAVVIGVLTIFTLQGCDQGRTETTSSPACHETQLDDVADVSDLFADAAVHCVVVAWDTDMDGAQLGPDRSVGTPGALEDAAHAGGFATPCETTVDPAQPSLTRAWFISRFAGLHPQASYWGVTLFARDRAPEGLEPWLGRVDAACAEITPP